MSDSPSVPPSVQAWTDETWKWGARSALPPDVAQVLALGDALRAENEVLRASREMWRTKRTDEISLDLAALRAENLRLREALQRIANWATADAGTSVQKVARAALGSVSSEPPREDPPPAPVVANDALIDHEWRPTSRRPHTNRILGALGFNMLEDDELASSEPPEEGT